MSTRGSCGGPVRVLIPLRHGDESVAFRGRQVRDTRVRSQPTIAGDGLQGPLNGCAWQRYRSRSPDSAVPTPPISRSRNLGLRPWLRCARSRTRGRLRCQSGATPRVPARSAESRHSQLTQAAAFDSRFGWQPRGIMSDARIYNSLPRDLPGVRSSVADRNAGRSNCRSAGRRVTNPSACELP